MTTNQQVDADESAPSKSGKGGRLKKVVLVVVPVLAVGIGAVLFLGGGGDDAAATTPTTIAMLSTEEGEVIEVDTMTVNLVGEEGRYARIGFAVVLSAEADRTIVGAKVPLMRDAALTTMTNYGPAELQSPEGIEQLRSDLSQAMIDLFPDGSILRAVLTELIVQ
jgi:flagellar basal body-associated protein FliL